MAKKSSSKTAAFSGLLVMAACTNDDCDWCDVSGCDDAAFKATKKCPKCHASLEFSSVDLA